MEELECLECECNKTKKIITCASVVLAGVSLLAITTCCLLKKMK